jgi:lysophospholipase L1-like esterase
LHRFRPLLANLVLAAVSVGVVLLVAEGAARLLLRNQGGGTEQDEASRYMEPHPRLGWRKRPGARATYRRREYTTEVAINRLGQRDPERKDPADPGTFRVLALGDSFVEGYTVPVESTLTQVAESALRGTGGGCPVEVLNGGTAAWSTDQEYLSFREDGARLAPQVVLVFFYYNDLFGNTTARYWGSPKPLLAAKDGSLAIANEPVPPPDAAEPLPADMRPELRKHRGSVALEWVRDRLARGAPRLYNAVARTRLWEPLGGDTIDRGDQLRVFKRRRQPEVEEAWTLTAAILGAFARDAQARGARFAAVYVPSRMEVSDRDWDLTRLSYGLDESVWDRALVRQRLEEVGRVAGFPVLDLTPALRAAAGPLKDVYLTYDGHWNAAGHRAVGDAVAEFLRARGWTPPCAAAGPR